MCSELNKVFFLPIGKGRQHNELQHSCSCRLVIFFLIWCLQEHIWNSSGYVVPWGTTVLVAGKLEELGLQAKRAQLWFTVMVSAMPVSANVMAKVLLVPASAVALLWGEIVLSVSHRGVAWCKQCLIGSKRMVMWSVWVWWCWEPNIYLIASLSS